VGGWVGGWGGDPTKAKISKGQKTTDRPKEWLERHSHRVCPYWGTKHDTDNKHTSHLLLNIPTDPSLASHLVIPPEIEICLPAHNTWAKWNQM
jgi:hypothetical protein